MKQATTLPLARISLIGLALASAPILAEDLTDLSLEELLDVEVTSVGKKAQSLADAAAAVFVISNEDIRRSGATSIPEALRMAPGIEVKRLDANKWAVSARGFNGRFANKLLVLIDGRTVYSPNFSGVYWESQDVMLADIERIEVIRGPGATLWGANAVNGVINIISKSAADTQGGLAIAGVGTEERALGALRYGFEPAEDTYARAYVKYHERDALTTIDGDDGHDDWNIGQGGFRVDSALDSGDTVTVQGDFYRSNQRQQLLMPDPSLPPYFSVPVDDRGSSTGWNLLGRWERALSVTSNLSAQLFYDHAERDEFYAGQSHDIIDFELQQQILIGKRHDLVWGLGYRSISDGFDSTPYIAMIPESDQRNQWSGFVQDDITLIEDRLRLTLGTKLEQNEYTGFEVQPNLRLLWKPTERSTLWSAVSRALRTPSRIERAGDALALVIPPGADDQLGQLPRSPLPIVINNKGSDDYSSEKLTAYELGFRIFPSRRLSIDAALFYNDYDALRTAGDEFPLPTFSPNGYLIVDLPFGNEAKGHSYGFELAAELQATDWWRLPIAYSYLELDAEATGDSRDQTNVAVARADPRQQLSLRSLMTPREDLDFDLWLRYADESYPDFGVGLYGTVQIPAYWELDLRLAWRPRPGIELSVVGQNLLSESHREGYQAVFGTIPVEVERGVYGAVRIDF